MKITKEWVKNWTNEALIHRARELRKASRLAAKAYTKDPMRSGCMILSEAYEEAAKALESRTQEVAS